MFQCLDSMTPSSKITSPATGPRSLRLFALASVALASCRSSPVLPAGAEVDHILVEEYAPTAVKPRHVIDTPEAIGKVLAVIRPHDRAWSNPMDTFPAPRCTVSLFRGTDLVTVIFIGSGWVGGRRGAEAANRARGAIDWPCPD